MKNKLYKKVLWKTKVRVHDYMLDVAWPREYRKAATKPVDPRKVLFIERMEADLPSSFRLLWQRLEATGEYDLQFVSLGKYQVGFREMNKRLMQLVPNIATAHFIFLNDASDFISCLPLRPETKVVQLWHACGAFKKWGMSLAGESFGRSKDYLRRRPDYGNLSLVAVSSPEVVWAYEEAMDLADAPGVVQPIGVSRTDVFFDKAFLSAARARLEVAIPECRGKRVLLYAPTFRGHMNGAKSPQFLDYQQLAESPGIRSSWCVVVKDHPLVKEPGSVGENAEGFAFNAPDDMDIDTLMAASDALLTDYSSVVFEYSLLGRPMAFLAPDLGEYYDERGFYYDYQSFAPGPIFTKTADVAAWMEQMTRAAADAEGHAETKASHAKIAAFRSRFMSSCDGHATDRIIEWM